MEWLASFPVSFEHDGVRFSGYMFPSCQKRDNGMPSAFKAIVNGQTFHLEWDGAGWRQRDGVPLSRDYIEAVVRETHRIYIKHLNMRSRHMAGWRSFYGDQ